MTRNLYVGGARRGLLGSMLASKLLASGYSASQITLNQLPRDAEARPYRAPVLDDPPSRQQRRKAARQQSKVVR